MTIENGSVDAAPRGHSHSTGSVPVDSCKKPLGNGRKPTCHVRASESMTFNDPRNPALKRYAGSNSMILSYFTLISLIFLPFQSFPSISSWRSQVAADRTPQGLCPAKMQFFRCVSSIQQFGCFETLHLTGLARLVNTLRALGSVVASSPNQPGLFGELTDLV